MNQESLQVIRSDRGSCLTTLACFVLMPIFCLAWIAMSNYVIDTRMIPRQELFSSEGLALLMVFFGLVLHEGCQYTVIRLFGGRPRYSNRKYDENRTRLERKYEFPVIMRFWSPDQKFHLIQYLIIVFSPTVMNYLLFPILMIIWQTSRFSGAIWALGFGNSLVIAFDFVIAMKIIASGKFNYSVVDKFEGTFLVKK